MEQFYLFTLKLHIFSVYASIFLAVFYTCITFYKDHKKALQSYWRFLPLYYFVLACMCFLGLLLLQFISNWTYIFLMFALWIFMIISSAKAYKLLKKSYTDKTYEQKALFFIRKKYPLDIFLTLIVYFLRSVF